MRFSLILTIAILCAAIYTPQVYAQANSTAANSTEDASIIDKLTYGKSGWKHLAIWSEALLTGYGAKIVGKIVRYFKPDVDPSLFEGAAEAGSRGYDFLKTKQDNTLAAWGVFISTNALTLGKGAAKRIPIAIALSGGYEYYKNYKSYPDDPEGYPRVERCYVDRNQTVCTGDPGITGPGGDHPDETTDSGARAIFYPWRDDPEYRFWLTEYNAVMDSFLITLLGALKNDSSCDRQIDAFYQKVREFNPDYEQHLELLQLKANESYKAALAVQQKVVEFAGTAEFPDFRSRQDVELFMASLTSAQRNELNSLLSTYFSKLDEFNAVAEVVLDDHVRATDAAILTRGFYGNADRLVDYLEFSNFPAVSDKPFNSKVLIIPTGGLYGLDSDEIFKAKLEKFVAEGGILIVFAQQHGYEFQALPGGKVSGYGWLEDQSCFSKAVYIDTYHPVLAGQDSVLMDINIDGYFTSWPENATVLFSRTANGMPAGIMYRYGKGWVVATTAYTDWAFAHGQRTGDGLAFVRDLLAWAVAESEGMEIPEYGHGDTANISVTITNRANSTATKVVFSIIDPNKNIVSNFSVSVAIAPGETKTVYASYLIRSESGIWSVDYALINATNETIQVGYDVARFVMKRVQNMSNEEFQSWITKNFYTTINKSGAHAEGV